MAELFGFSITRLKQKADPKQSFTTAQADDGTQTVSAGGHFGSYLDMEGTAKTEQDLIRRYREIALHPECDMAIEDIVNEAIVANELKDAVRVIFNDLPYGRDIQRKIEDEFQEVLRLMNFNTKGHDVFRRWYVDGRIFYQKIIDRDNPKKGITELKYIDPRKIKKIREVRKKRPDVPSPSALNSLAVVDEYIEYFLIKNKNSKPDKDMLFKYILINMLGIKIDNNTDLKPFFEKLNNDTKQFIETYLVTDNLIPGSFLKILRTLYDHLRFLHLDFKMKNIFVRYKTNIDRHDEYKNFECVIGDLDKSRLQIDFNNVYINESTV